MAFINYSMALKLMKYPLSENEFIRINPFEFEREACEFCAHIDIDYNNLQTNEWFRFGYEKVSNFCSRFLDGDFLQKVLKGKMVTEKNLGLEWNLFFQGQILKTDIEKFLLFSNSHKQIRPYYSSWLYNDAAGNIIFEITPFYAWTEQDISNPEYQAFDDFIKNYKPAIRMIIEKKYIRSWIKITKQLEMELGIQIQG